MIDLTIILGVGIVLTLYLLYVHANRKKEELFVKELVELSIEMAKKRELIRQKDVEIEELRRIK